LTIQSITQSWKRFSESARGKRIIKYTRRIVVLAIFSYLFYKLNQIGWLEILQSLPSSPLFYLIFILSYILLPISEQFIYRLSLNFGFWEGFRVFVIKKILNLDLVSYSGEAYFFAWGKQRLNVTNKYLFYVVKDNNIISSVASTLTAILMVLTLSYYGQIDFLRFFTVSKLTLIIIVAIVLLLLILGFRYRKKLIAFNRSTTLKIFMIHELRIIAMYGLDILMCYIALPEVPLSMWFTCLAIKVISSRIPFLPSQDILLLGIYADIAKQYGILQAEIMAVFITIAALSKLLNALLYGILSVSGLGATLPSKKEETEDQSIP